MKDSSFVGRRGTLSETLRVRQADKMIFERMSANVFRKVRQLESLSKTSLLSSSGKPHQFRTSTSLAAFNRCLNSTAANDSRILARFPVAPAVGSQVSRNASTGADHVRVWVMEKLVSVALPLVIPAALICESKILDGAMSLLVVMHTHWGLEAIITDYARPSVVGTIVPKALHGALILLSAATLAGLFMLINNGPGVARSIKCFWAIGNEPKKPEKSIPAPEKPAE